MEGSLVMKISLITVGETHKKWAKEGEEEYISRLKHYISFEKLSVADIKKGKSLSVNQQKELEGLGIKAQLQPGDYVVLLDERGKEFSSRGLATELQLQMNRGVKRLVFIIGGPYGFSEEIYKRCDARMSLSKLTFPHDLARVVFVEQLYRAFTILKGEPYHHD